MKNHNSTFLIIMAIGFLVSLVSLFSGVEYDTSWETDWTFVGIAIAQVGGLFMLLANGTFIVSKFYRYLKLIVSFCLIGILFVIMSWPYADLILSLGFIGIAINYFLSFLAKPIKKALDYFKLMYVISSFAYAILRFLHIVKEEYHLISTVFIWLAIVEYIRLEYKAGRHLKKGGPITKDTHTG